MDTSGRLLPESPYEPNAPASTSGATADFKPLNWGPEADTCLMTLYKRTPVFDIKYFKSLIPSISQDSYDLLFLESRLGKLLGPLAPGLEPATKTKPSTAAPNYLHRTWLLLEQKDGRYKHLSCVKCTTTPVAIYRNVKTQHLRCGHCGNMDWRFPPGNVNSSPNGSTPPGSLVDRGIVQQCAESRTQCLSAEGRTQQGTGGYLALGEPPVVDLDGVSTRTPLDMPEHWNVFADMALKKTYSTNPKQFNINAFKKRIHESFHGPANLCIHPDSYDFGFLHERLDRLIGPCVCRWSQEDRAKLTREHEPSFFHREWNALKVDQLGHRLYCTRCGVTPPLISQNEKFKEFYRCGACGNSAISRMPTDEAYSEYLNHIMQGINCILGKRKAAGLPEFSTGDVQATVRKRMRVFEQNRVDKPQAVQESDQAGEQEVAGVTMDSVQRPAGDGRI